MYTSLAAAKAAVISVGEEIATFGLPSGICPLLFVFTGSGNGAFTLLVTTLFCYDFHDGQQGEQIDSFFPICICISSVFV